jgi:hypothetical protein
MPRNLDSSSSLSRPLCAWDDASLMTTLRHHNDCDMMPHHSLIQQVTSHNQPQQALIITYYEYGHARKLRKPNKQTAAPSTEHRAPSTEHRAPSTEHRAPSTEHRAPSTEHRRTRKLLSQETTGHYYKSSFQIFCSLLLHTLAKNLEVLIRP